MGTAREKKGRKRGRNFFMTFDELWGEVGGGRNQLYQRLKDGTFPTLKIGRLRKILRKPTEAILRGEIPPGSAEATKVLPQGKASKASRRQSGAP